MSRFAFRAVSSSPLVTSAGHRFPTCLVGWRGYSSGAPASDKPMLPKTEKLSVEETIKNWDAANKLYYGPERDLVNFPHPTISEHSPPTRLGFIPETWFQFLYEKTGVTGPYCLGFGTLTYVLSKEIWIIEHGFSHFVAYWVLMYFLIKKYGHKIGAHLDKMSEGINERHWYKPMRKTVGEAEAAIKTAEDIIWREAGQKHLFESKRENVDLQLESVYRQRLNEVHQTVKKRLDYQMEVDTTRRRLQQQHMVQWIVDQVVKGITPQQEKDSLSKCIGDLKSIASKNPATA